MTDQDEQTQEPLVALLVEEDEEIVLDITADDSAVVIDLTSTHMRSELVADDEDTVHVPDEDEPEVVEANREHAVISLINRRREKLRLSSRTKRQWILLASGVLVGIIVCTFAVLESPFYNVDHINLRTPQALSDSQSASVNKILERVKGRQLYRSDFSGVEKSLDELSFVSDATITKKWPSTVDVTVSSRVPVAYITTDKGVVLVDNNAMVYEKTKEAPVGLTSIEGIDEVTLHSPLTDTTYTDILDVAPPEIKGQIAHITLEKQSYLVTLTDGISVELGDSSQLREKLAITWSIINAKKRSELGYIDVSVPSLPVSGSPQLKV